MQEIIQKLLSRKFIVCLAGLLALFSGVQEQYIIPILTTIATYLAANVLNKKISK